MCRAMTTSHTVRALAALLILGLGGCKESPKPAPKGDKSPPAKPAVAPPAAKPTAVDPPTTVGPVAEVPAAETPAPYCVGHPACRVTARNDAGTADGHEMTVLEVALHKREGDWKWPNMDECAPYEYWLEVKAAGTATRWQPLLELCNDGYGSSMVGEDSVTVGPNAFTHDQNGGSAWRWSTRRVVQLMPYRLVSETLGSSHNGSGADEQVTWDHAAFGGDLSWSCDEAGAVVWKTALVPSVETPADYRKAGWRVTDLGTCALTVDATGKGGYLAHGAPGAAADARMSVVHSGGTLYVDVFDDQWETSAERWIYTDHLELWVSARDVGSYGCDGDETPVQWGINITDGTVYPGFGKPTAAPKVAVAKAGAARRVAITLPEQPGSITLVYSDTDDGKTQERLLATSPIKMGKGHTLGRLHRVSENAATCVTEEGSLNVRPTPRDPSQPALR